MTSAAGAVVVSGRGSIWIQIEPQPNEHTHLTTMARVTLSRSEVSSFWAARIGGHMRWRHRQTAAVTFGRIGSCCLLNNDSKA
jgi:hypothetical protein